MPEPSVAGASLKRRPDEQHRSGITGTYLAEDDGEAERSPASSDRAGAALSRASGVMARDRDRMLGIPPVVAPRVGDL